MSSFFDKSNPGADRTGADEASVASGEAKPSTRLAGLLCAIAARPYDKGSGRRRTATERHVGQVAGVM